MAKILVAEDEPIILLVLSEVLNEAGHQVIEASHGEQALARLEPDVDVIVSDMMMPHMGGAEWVASARERAGFEAIPVIFMSALPPPEEARALMTVFLAKPFRPSTLVVTVQKLLNGAA